MHRVWLQEQKRPAPRTRRPIPPLPGKDEPGPPRQGPGPAHPPGEDPECTGQIRGGLLCGRRAPTGGGGTRCVVSSPGPADPSRWVQG